MTTQAPPTAFLPLLRSQYERFGDLPGLYPLKVKLSWLQLPILHNTQKL